MTAEPGQLATALERNPTLKLLGSYSRDWVLPLFAEHLEPAEAPVSAEWFHERVAEALEVATQWKSDRSPADHCRKWVDDRWLEAEYEGGRVHYRLSAYSLRAIQFVRELVDGESTVTGARLNNIASAVHSLATMTNPDREAQVERLDKQIRELEVRRENIRSGRQRLATVEEMRQQLNEVLGMTRSLPADFRQLRTLVEDRHQAVARRALTDGPTKAQLVDDYLHEHDLLSQTAEGRSYRGFSQALSQADAHTFREDVAMILDQDFAREHMSGAQREQLETLYSTLLNEQLAVQKSYVRWTGSLRRFLTRAASGRHRRLLALAEQALAAGAEWAVQVPGRRYLDDDVLRVGTASVVDASGLRLWAETRQQTMAVVSEQDQARLPVSDRAALRLAAGTSPRAVARTINLLLERSGVVTGAEAFESTPPEFQRLGALVTLLDLAISFGTVDTSSRDAVAFSVDPERALRVILPQLSFHEPIRLDSKESA
ncbi:DUF3375 domain-containing protein [Agromyces mediolanus]|uniref:DUF3375 family protein n=1 Tax=Agromyces mediolanus TaxID=41986 RepID=UPI0020403E61|nr:DUF3375 family protein [Agromyces mediolanus]MCM3658984.1 DUF3375 domain-containing protein [Agromyces mediolanus]